MQSTVMVLLGTRPEAIKLAPVIKVLRGRTTLFRTVVCSTGQHREMLRQAVDLFGIACDMELDVMQPNQTLPALTGTLFHAIGGAVAQARPDWVVVQGDTATAFVGATVGYYHGVKVGHVEAGLRTGDKFRPFPEEANRRAVTVVADAHFAPTEWARRHLLAEGVDGGAIHVTGNTVVDAVLEISRRPYEWSAGPLAPVPRHRPLVLITAHRRESFGEPFRQICCAIRDLAERYARAGVEFVYPVHLNPNVQRPVMEILGGLRNVRLLEPLDYLSMVHLMMHSRLVLTDSGGIQEEAPAFGIPVCVMRDTTERPEGIQAGVARLVGTSRESIVRLADPILAKALSAGAVGRSPNPYGDGKAAQRIADVLAAARLQYMGRSIPGDRPEPVASKNVA